ncbi:MAG: DNRLRE domain-containing protein [Candidatus Hodarchaeaceae archaeon]|nr:DNRLRE domain-containing protein [Candidatus Hodarchaeaceae archaeon]
MEDKIKLISPLTLTLALVSLSTVLALASQFGYVPMGSDVQISTNSSFGLSPPEATVKELLPTDDSHVMEGRPDTVSDGGKRYNMYVGWDSPKYLSERIYLKFDLSEIPAGAVIENAVLGLYNKYSPSIGESPYTPKTITVDAKEVENDGWSEATITWNNAPTMGSVLDTKTISSTDKEKWTLWNVTSFVRSELAGDKTVSIGLMSKNEGIDDAVVWFYTKDAAEDQPRPYLKISYYIEEVPPPRPERGVEVSISPPSKTGKPEDILTYTVTVRNTGSLSDNYALNVTDTLGWAPTVSPTSLSVAAGESGTATVRVGIPATAENRASTTITVRVAGTEVENSATCRAIAQVEAPPPKPTEIPWAYVGIAVVIVVAIIAAVLVKRR